MDTKDILDELELVKNLNIDSMPEIDLYIDQVMQIFENKLSPLKRNEEEKILTKTMINNYAKAKLLLPIKNKKYTKEHLMLMSIIYNMKGVMSLNDIKLSLEKIIETKVKDKEYNLEHLYKKSVELSDKDAKEFREVVREKIDNINLSSNNTNEDFEKEFLILFSLVNMSNMYRRYAEKIIDELIK